MSSMIRKIFTVAIVLIFVIINVLTAKIEQEKNLQSQDGVIVFPDQYSDNTEHEQMFYHNPHHPYHHNPAFHHHHHTFHTDEENNDGKNEKNPISRIPESSTPEYADTNKSTEIPLQFIQEINQANYTELLSNYFEDNEEDHIYVQNRFGDADGSERDAAVMPKPAGCQPELQTVKLVPADDLSTFYFPSCTRVERCGGCCSHTLLSCQPQETETLSFRIIKSVYKGRSNKLSIVDKEVIQVEKHTKCKCDCIIQPQDCNPYQEYKKNECKCTCKNRDEEKKCLKNSKKLWNPDRCGCECREITTCSTGTEFDQSECRCKRMIMRRRFADYSERNSYLTEPPPDEK